MKPNILELTKEHIEKRKAQIHGKVSDYLIFELENLNYLGIKFYLSDGKIDSYEKMNLFEKIEVMEEVKAWIRANYSYFVNEIHVTSHVKHVSI